MNTKLECDALVSLKIAREAIEKLDETLATKEKHIPFNVVAFLLSSSGIDPSRENVVLWRENLKRSYRAARRLYNKKEQIRCFQYTGGPSSMAGYTYWAEVRPDDPRHSLYGAWEAAIKLLAFDLMPR